MVAPPKIIELVDRFERNKKEYMSSGYNETQVRREFVDPFFEALGWDVNNALGKAEAYKDVVHEDALKIGKTTKAPDYSFRIGGTRKFFLETKKPSVDIERDVSPAYQIRRYSWNADLPLAILTDFEEFAVYDCRVKPKPNDPASVARIMLFRYTDYAEKWDEIKDVFSKNAIEMGSFDRFAEGVKGKRGTSEVGDEFLKEIEGWRAELAKNIALRNIRLSIREMNFAVQKTIDRLLFLRICEDRGIEPYGQLQELASKENVYKRLKELFKAADEKYNSGIFHFTEEKGRKSSPDCLTMGIKIDDKPLQAIIKRLYYPECPYEFSVLGVDILGNVYEQFLGKVIRLTAGHRAVVEEKPEVKKAGGVYYTPKYIVDYIVSNTVGKLIDGKTPKQISSLKVLDPACGSGSFLIGAYTKLLDYHRDWYVAHTPGKYKEEIYQGKGGQWYLTTKEKRRILLNNVYGVDIDNQAVEVTKLNLSLKVLENENQDTLLFQKKLIRERALPDLDNNIKCGNSLIEPDFYVGQTTLDMEAQQRVNVFDWETEFPFKFDAVIGNPPYVFTRDVDFQNDFKNYTQNKYFKNLETISKSHARQAGKINLYSLFLLRGVTLLAERGLLGFIIPNNILRTTTYDIIRKSIMDTCRIKQVVDMGSNIFRGVTASTVIILLERTLDEKLRLNNKVVILTKISDLTKHSCERALIKQREFLNNTSYTFNIIATGSNRVLLKNIEEGCIKLGEIVVIHAGGIATGPDKNSMIENYAKNFRYKPMLEGKDIKPHYPHFANRYIRYDKNLLYRARDESIFLSPEKLVTQRIGGGKRVLVVAYDDEQYYTFNSTNTLLKKGNDYSLKYLSALLNSKLLNYYYVNKFTNQSTLTVNISKTFLEQLPIKRISLYEQESLISMINKVIQFNKQLRLVKTPDEKTLLQRQIDAVDKQIDKLVYGLYGLTEEEIKLVEDFCGKK
jgi:type I restriction-modification system DNA methylase subunit